mmetsp:Transcript_25129/g.37233  ORF Transcript_25129/g.37233 Transcript_25129/m.37233 type:complete len:307 (+) Transcript_25129:372-1292(+)
MSTHQHQKLARVLYRSLLRVSRKGNHPEVFGKYGKQAKEYPLPHTASEVRAILRGGFRMGKTSRAIDVANIDTTDRQSKHDAIKEAFEILRHSNEMSSILLPQKDDLPSALPIFEYTDAGVLMEEEIQFNFFEPRYRFLAQEALSRDGTFILGQKHSSSLVKIVEHMFLPNGNIAVRCIGGPRIKVLRREKVNVGEDNVLAQATKFDIESDDFDEESQQNLFAMRLRFLELMKCVYPKTNITSMGLPPIDPERFSFWALRFTLSQSDPASRQRWLACLSTNMRLQHVIEFFESFQEVLNSDPKDES